MFSHHDLFTHDQLEDRRIDGVAKMVFVCLFLCLFLYYREQVDSILRCVCSVVDHRRQIKCGKNITDALGYRHVYHFFVLTLF